MLDIEKIKSTREKCFHTTQEELKSWVQEFKNACEDDYAGGKKFELLLVQLIIHEAIFQPVDFKLLESVYQRLVEEQWPEDEEADFPLKLKVEFLLEFHALFVDLGHLTRAQNIVDIIEKVALKHPDDSDIGYVYVKILYNVPLDILMLKNPDIKYHFEKIQEIIKNYKFDDKQLKELEFLQIKCYADLYSNTNPNEGIQYIDRLVKIV